MRSFAQFLPVKFVYKLPFVFFFSSFSYCVGCKGSEQILTVKKQNNITYHNIFQHLRRCKSLNLAVIYFCKYKALLMLSGEIGQDCHKSFKLMYSLYSKSQPLVSSHPPPSIWRKKLNQPLLLNYTSTLYIVRMVHVTIHCKTSNSYNNNGEDDDHDDGGDDG